jgi:hypothetical protein
MLNADKGHFSEDLGLHDGRKLHIGIVQARFGAGL